MKKTLALIMALSMSVCAFAACGESDDDDSTGSKKSSSSSYDDDDDDADYSGSNKNKKKEGGESSEADTEPVTDEPETEEPETEEPETTTEEITTEPETEKPEPTTEEATPVPAVLDDSYEDVIMDFETAINTQDGEGMLNAMFPSFVMTGLKEQLGSEWDSYLEMISEGFAQGFAGTAGESIAADFLVVLNPKSAEALTDISAQQAAVDEYCTELGISEKHTVEAAYTVTTNMSVTNNGKSNARDVDLIVYYVDNEWRIDTSSME